MAKYVKTEQGYIETEDFLDGKMDKENPHGTGSFSLNRKAGSTVGDFSHTEGQDTTASGYASHAEGCDTTASKNYSHAEGYGTTALGVSSHAEGFNTTASGNYSHAEGFYTIASVEAQHVQGKYNISDTTSAHIVGNGSGSNKSNAHTLDWSGNAWFAGDVYTGSTSGKNKDDGSVKLPVVYSGTTAPTNDIGKNGDLYVLLDS